MLQNPYFRYYLGLEDVTEPDFGLITDVVLFNSILNKKDYIKDRLN